MVCLDNLFQRIKDCKITAKKLSEDTGISTGNISDWKNGRSMPSASKLDILADYLDCSVDYLLGRDEAISDNYIVSDKYEKMVIDQFRTLSDQGKEYILQTLAMAVNQYKKDIALEYNERQVN